jgi:hypothetical protein
MGSLDSVLPDVSEREDGDDGPKGEEEPFDREFCPSKTEKETSSNQSKRFTEGRRY